MKVKIITRSAPRKALIEASVGLFIRRLNLEKSQYSLIVYSIANLAKFEGMNGAAVRTGPKEISIGLDSRLPMHSLVTTLAHEMIHFKQHAKGQLKQVTNKRGKTTFRWLGKVCPSHNFNSPWEIEAYSKERLLGNEILELITNLSK